MACYYKHVLKKDTGNYGNRVIMEYVYYCPTLNKIASSCYKTDKVYGGVVTDGVNDHYYYIGVL